jgi:hypothetical protein
MFFSYVKNRVFHKTACTLARVTQPHIFCSYYFTKHHTYQNNFNMLHMDFTFILEDCVLVYLT